jgi:hypothetical protein
MKPEPAGFICLVNMTIIYTVAQVRLRLTINESSDQRSRWEPSIIVVVIFVIVIVINIKPIDFQRVGAGDFEFHAAFFTFDVIAAEGTEVDLDGRITRQTFYRIHKKPPKTVVNLLIQFAFQGIGGSRSWVAIDIIVHLKPVNFQWYIPHHTKHSLAMRAGNAVTDLHTRRHGEFARTKQTVNNHTEKNRLYQCQMNQFVQTISPLCAKNVANLCKSTVN